MASYAHMEKAEISHFSPPVLQCYIAMLIWDNMAGVQMYSWFVFYCKCEVHGCDFLALFA